MKASQKNTSIMKKRCLELYSMCSLPMLLVFLFSYIPMFGIIIAFKKYDFDLGVFGSKWVGFKNFKYFFKSNVFSKIAWNTVYLNTIFIFVGIFCAVLLAILLFSIQSRNNVKIYQTVMITPHFLSWVVVGYMLYAFLNPEYGLVNTTLRSMGIAEIQWYSDSSLWPWILTVASVWKTVGMDAVIYYAALMGIDSTLFEAAAIDGAGKRLIIKEIILKALTPLITIMTIIKIGGIFRADFGMFYQLTRDCGELYATTDVMDTYIFRTMRVVGDMSTSAAAGLLQSVVGFVLVLITNTAVKFIDSDRALF